MPEFEALPLAARNDITRGTLRLREIAVGAMVETTAQQRMSVVNKTSKHRVGIERKFELSGLMVFYRKPQDKDVIGWKGPAVITGISALSDGQISYKWQGRNLSRNVSILRPLDNFLVFAVFGKRSHG